MTQPHEVTVTREQAEKVWRHYSSLLMKGVNAYDALAQTLAAFLADRVPDAMDAGDDDYSKQALKANAHNALRDAVLKGPQA